MTVKGASGKLKTKVIGDFLTHTDLTDLELERQQYFTKEKKDEKLDADYVPVDFDSYSIPSHEAQPKGPLPKDEKIWRISSLTASVDDETKILVLPLAESKRQVKIKDTKYQIDSFDKLRDNAIKIENDLAIEKGTVKRYEDKT